MNGSRKLVSRSLFPMFAMLAVVLRLTAGACPALGQACAGQNWTTPTPNVWASGESVKVLLNNDATTNQPTIPTYLDDGNFNPWGYQQHPQAITVLNPVFSCPLGTPVITVAGSGRETVSFQVFISAGVGSNSALSDVSVAVSPLTGAGTLTSDNTGNSNITRYLEGYVPYTGANPNAPPQLQANGQMPDPLIPFYDPYDSGNPAVATPFNVQSGTTQGVWVNISIPGNQAAGAYAGTVTVTGNGIGSVSIPVNMTVWNGSLPTFDAGSVNPTYADMLKSWLPFYRGNFDRGEGMTCGGPGCTTEQALLGKYQIMGHAYDMDVQIDVDGPAANALYPGYGNATSFTTDGTTSSLDWTAYDAYVGPALTPGGLFSDGTAMRVFDSPLSTAGGGAWVAGGWNWTEQNGNAPVPPAGLMQLVTNYSTQISQHFASNHTTKGWGQPELISYTFDETYNYGHSKDIGGNPLIYQIISSYNEAINSSDSALSATWDPSTAPIHNFLTDMPACEESGDNTSYTDAACADHINLSYPGGPNATAGYPNSWVNVWSPNPFVFMPGRPGPAFHSGYTPTPTLIAGTGYQYTMDLTDGVPALSTAPLPIERWFYQGGDPASTGDGISATGVGQRINYWIAYKYGLDETIPSVGDPHPVAPAPGGVWVWVGDFWGGYNGSASPSNCGGGAPSPFVSAATGGDGVLFYPGNEIGCYYTANPVGQAALTASPAVNASCTSNGYNVCNGISGPVASMRMEAMRRGYQDYEYMYLLGKQSGRAAPLAIINSLGGAGMTAGGLGTTSWNALNWDNVDAPNYISGVEPESDAYTGNCTDSTPGIGGLPNGLPNGPTGSASSGPAFNYGGCPGEWTNNPYRFEAARVQLAQALGFAPANTAPSVTGLSPSSGVNSGGSSVIIAGTNFSGATTVQFGGVSAASFTVNSATQITAVTPAGNGTVDVQVFGPGGGSLPSSGDLYTYVSPVTVTGLSPSQGVAAGGTSVNITGTDFAAGAIVKFGNSSATNVVVNSATSITATSPAGSNTVDVTVTTAQGTSAINSSDQYVYEAAPTVTGVSPNNGPIPGGTSVTIGGSGFVSGMTVNFGANAATNVVVGSATSLTATSPAGSSNSGGVVDVTATTTNGSSLINGGDQFTYTSPVTVTGLSVNNGPPAGGTSVIITGTDFTGATAVKFGGNTASFTVNSSTSITATSPAGGGTVDVTVTTPPYSSGHAPADLFTYSAAVAGGTFATLPTTAVGSTSTTQNVSITLQSASAISSITVPPTQNGVQEFTVGTVSGCSVGGASNPSGTVCTVPITFHPQYPGIRLGTLTINNNGAVIGTAGLAGIGQGPQVAVSPGALARAIGGGASGVTATPQSVATAALSVSNNGSALAMDGAGNLYIADDINCLAYKVTATTNQIVVIAGNYTFASGAVTPSTTPEPALGSNTCPQAIAVDGAGNVYIGDAHAVDSNGYPNVVEEVSATTGEIQVIAGGGTATANTTPQPALNVAINAINSLATDSAGNLYISDFFNNLVEQVNPAGQIVAFAGGGSTPVSTTPQPATSAALNGPTGMVMDASGNFYISDQNIGVIERVNASGQIVSIAGGGSSAPSMTPQPALSVAISNPAGLAVDGAGDLYIADFSNQVVDQVNVAGQLVVVAGGGGTVPTATPESSNNAQLGLIEGVEVDGAGNIYIADGQDIGGGDNMVEKVSAAGQPLSFPFINVGSTSVPQSLNLTNIGNQALNLTSVGATTDFPLQAGGSCTVTANSGQTLPVSNSCSLSYAFHPTEGGVLNEAATLTDNNLNASNATQPLSFTGTGVGGTNPQLTSINPPSGAGGDVVTVTGINLSGATAMTFGSSPVTPSSSTSTTVTAIAPPGSGTVSVTVTTANGTSNGESFNYTTVAAATPTFSPAAGTYPTAQTVTISDSTSGATIYYTTNGTTPTTSSPVYSSPISVSTSETVEAIATASGHTTSAVGSAAYAIDKDAEAPTFTPAAGTYNSTQTVTISTTTKSATIYYTTDGTKPTTGSTVYSGPISISASETVKAIATATGYKTSAVASARYVLKVATPTLSPAEGTYSSTQTVTISTATSGATIYYTTNGKTPTTGSTVYSGPITVSATETVKAQAVKSGYTDSAIASAKYTLTVATPTFSPAAGSYGSTQTVTISTTTPSATIYYTTNGKTPTTKSPVYFGPIAVSSTETIQAMARATGYTNSAVGSATYTLIGATPTFSPAAGNYSSAQTVTISDTSSGATIHYTTNGTTPTTSSTVYSGPTTVSATETLEALAVESGYTNSAIGSAAYTLTVATPTFNPLAGTYSSTQTVTISDATSGATIHYTTDGTTPTASSTAYSAPITVSATETAKALAVESGYTNSAVASATYTLTAATPAFSPGSGTYTSAQTVAIGDTTSGVTIYYTTDGTTPTTGSAVYSSPINVTANESVRALAVKSGYTNSAVGSAAYVIGIGGNQVTDSFSGSGALSSNWTNMSAQAQAGLSYKPVPLVQSNGTVVPGPSAPPTSYPWGWELYTGVAFNNDQYSQVKFVAHSAAGGGTGPCVRMNANGNSYCYVADNGAIVTFSNGVWYQTILSTCPIPASGDTIQLSAVGTTITCSDITQGTSANVTDSVFGAGSPGIMVDRRQSAVYALALFQAD